MRVRIQAVTKETKRDKFSGEIVTGVKFNDGWHDMKGDMRHLRNQEADIELDAKGKWARLIEPIVDVGPGGRTIVESNKLVTPTPVTNGKIPWADCKDMIILAHTLASQLEPDNDMVDHSVARSSIVNTIFRDFCNGHIALPEEREPGEDEPRGAPQDIDDDYPWPEGVK